MLKTWHRVAGLFAAAFLLILTVTGLLLMQTGDLDLDSRYISNDRVLDWYGIRPAPPPLTFAVNNHWITQVGSRLYFDAAYLLNVDAELIGAVAVADEFLVASTAGLLLLTAHGDVAERLDETAGIPRALTHIGTTPAGAIVLQSTDGLFVFEPHSTRVQFSNANIPVHWRSTTSAPAEIIDTINRGYRGAGLTLERIIIDLHTGRFFGAAGVALINLSSILLLVLIVSGISLWVRRARGNGANRPSD